MEKHVLSVTEKSLVSLFKSKVHSPTELDCTYKVDEEFFKLFADTLKQDPSAQHLSSEGYVITNKLLLDLATPEHWVDTLHMELLASLAESRYRETLSRERATFIPPWLLQHFQGKYRSFKAGTDKSKFRIAETFGKYITTPGKVWFEDIEMVYSAMIWEGKHWVGLFINLPMWYVEVLDPNPSWRDDEKAKEYMAPVLELLPYAIKQFRKHGPKERPNLQPFGFQRVSGAYHNTRSGDCGPVSAKFMELHVHGLSSTHFHTITDVDVNNFRRQYAIDVFKHFVEPLY